MVKLSKEENYRKETRFTRMISPAMDPVNCAGGEANNSWDPHSRPHSRRWKCYRKSRRSAVLHNITSNLHVSSVRSLRTAVVCTSRQTCTDVLPNWELLIPCQLGRLQGQIAASGTCWPASSSAFLIENLRVNEV